jgi:hypothetical protein
MSREEAINILNDYDINFERHTAEEVAEAHEMAIKALQQQPSEDCISRKAVLDGLASIAKAKAKSDSQKSLMGRVMFFTEHLPSVTPQPKAGHEPKTGHWIYFTAVNTGEIIWSECSKCGNEERGCAQRMKYCPECGIKMQEVKK